MALNGSHIFNNGAGQTMVFSWTATQSPVNSTSVISWSLNMGQADCAYQITLTIDGEQVFSGGQIGPFGSIIAPAGSEITSGTYTITHDASGAAKDFAVKLAGNICFPSSASSGPFNPIGGTVTFTLDAISRKSTVSSTSGYIGDNVTITISRYVSSFTHTLKYTFGSLSGQTIITNYSGTKYTWTLPSNFVNQIPANAKSRTGTIICETYNGSTKLGESTATFTATIKEDDSRPIIDPIVEDGNTVTSALTGDINKFVRYFSTAVFAIQAEARNGATIVSQYAKCGSVFNESATGEFPNVESGTFSFFALDSRNFLTTQTIEKELIPYVKLTCNMSNNTPDTNGNFNFTISGNYFNGSFGKVNNTLTVQYRYKKQDGSFGSWTTLSNITYTQAESNVVYNGNVSLTGLDYQTTYIFELKAVDKLMTITPAPKVVKSTPVFDWSGDDFNFNVPVGMNDTPIMKHDPQTQDLYIATGTSNIHIRPNGLDDGTNEILIKPNGSIYAKGFNLTGLGQIMSYRQAIECETNPNSNLYSAASVDLYLYGNTMRGYFSLTRKSNATGNIAKEICCSVTFDASMIAGFGATSWVSSNDGVLASFHMDNTTIYQDDGSVDPSQVGKGYFQIYLDATAAAGNTWAGYFTFPVLLKLD